MKDSRRSAPTRKSARRVFAASPPSSLARPAPSTATKTTASRIADKMQLLALRRPNMLHLLEHLLDGMLKESRRDDDHARLDD